MPYPQESSKKFLMTVILKGLSTNLTEKCHHLWKEVTLGNAQQRLLEPENGVRKEDGTSTREYVRICIVSK